MTDQDKNKLKNETLTQLEKEKFINLSAKSRETIERALDILLTKLPHQQPGDEK